MRSCFDYLLTYRRVHSSRSHHYSKCTCTIIAAACPQLFEPVTDNDAADAASASTSTSTDDDEKESVDDDGCGRTDECANGEANVFDRPRTAPLRNVYSN